jgi:hypothetical protein
MYFFPSGLVLADPLFQSLTPFSVASYIRARKAGGAGHPAAE